MTGNFLSLFVFGTVLIAVQGLALLPWLFALGARTRQRAREPRFWLQCLAVALLLSTVLLKRDRSDSSYPGPVEHSGIAGDVVDELPLSVPAGVDQ